MNVTFPARAGATKSARSLVPAAPGHFFWGVARQIEQEGLLGCYQRCVDEGRDIARLRIVTKQWTVLFHPRHIEKLLHGSYRELDKGSAWNNIRGVIGDGLITSEGRSWLNQRRTLQPSFHALRHQSFAEQMGVAIEKMLRRWQVQTRAQNSEPVEITAEMSRLTLETAGLALFGADFEARSERMGRDLMFALNYSGHFTLLPFDLRPLRHPRAHRGYRKTLASLHQSIESLLQERSRHRHDEPNVLDAILNLREGEGGKSRPASRKHLIYQVMTFILTGYETTALSLTWLWYLVVAHPEVEKRIHEEVNRVLNGRVPTYEDLPQFVYLRQVACEALRLYPPVWNFGRQNREDLEVDGYHIPAGSVLSFVPFITHRHPEFWPDPEKFDPERFAPGAERHKFAYFPFGVGARQCIGSQFAIMELLLTIATIVQRYSMTLVPDQDITPVPGTTLRPRNGIYVTLHEREHAA
jgi:cytochrome P450